MLKNIEVNNKNPFPKKEIRKNNLNNLLKGKINENVLNNKKYNFYIIYFVLFYYFEIFVENLFLNLK